MFDAVIIGAGFAGAVLAERLATQQNKKILLVEKRQHIGGNCYDYRDKMELLSTNMGLIFFIAIAVRYGSIYLSLLSGIFISIMFWPALMASLFLFHLI